MSDKKEVVEENPPMQLEVKTLFKYMNVLMVLLVVAFASYMIGVQNGYDHYIVEDCEKKPHLKQENIETLVRDYIELDLGLNQTKSVCLDSYYNCKTNEWLLHCYSESVSVTFKVDDHFGSILAVIPANYPGNYSKQIWSDMK